jgi:hypothetical protein
MTAITADEIRAVIEQFSRDIEEITSSYACEVDKIPPSPMIYHYTNDVGIIYKRDSTTS